jgi:hypothetical protein
VQIKAVLLHNRYLANLRSVRHCGPRLELCRATTDENRAARPRSRSLLERYPPVALGPLAELRLDDVVDVNPDAADVALVDLDLMQARGGMGVSPR